MKYSFALTAIAAAANICFTNAAPTPEPDDVAVSDIENPDGDEPANPELGIGRQVWKCADEAPTPPRIDYEQCKLSINDFDTQYFSAGVSREKVFTLTHKPKPAEPNPDTVYCPDPHQPDEQRNLCKFTFDYKTYPSDRDEKEYLNRVKSNAESFIRKCEREGKYGGGYMDVLWGSHKWRLYLDQVIVPPTNEPLAARPHDGPGAATA